MFYRPATGSVDTMEAMVGRCAFAPAFAVLLSLAAVRDARAVPMSTDLATIRAEATTIVVGVVHLAIPGGVLEETIDVDTVVRGTAHPGRMKVLPSPDGTVDVDGARVVAFVDAKGRLRWVGVPVAGPSVEDGVLLLHGFLDQNAHLVSPGLMSLAQLRGYLATGRLEQTYRVTLAFPDGHGGLQRSARSLLVRYDPIARRMPPVVTGFAAVCLAPFWVSGLERGRLELSFSDACEHRPGARGHALELEGRASGLDPATGDIEFVVTPTRPLLDASELDAFLHDPWVVDVRRNVRVQLSDGTAWTLRVGAGIVDPSGAVHAGTTAGFSSNGHDAWDEYGFDGGSILVVSPTARTVASAGDPLGFVQLVDSGRVTRCLFARPGAPVVTCTLRSEPPLWIRR